ncbi:phytoene desaturase family protein [Aureliella helgolandensis]|uniref:phytoene desaturase family protein n=1 Tax=Aureliella helgolandensis TaxID=2527968 RepID=UPI0011A1AF46|nr:NAD(P)/FAD-dependent oxidoreductase [Aureliella helgolandensis]
MYDTIIIGGGMSGLAAGIRLAHYDQKVCILEKHWTIGGLNSFYRQNGRNYDVGLHAVTNFTPAGTKKGPLARLLRQLRFRWEDFELSPQMGSAIAFPGVRIGFNNELDFLRSEIARTFPSQIDNFELLLSKLADYDDLTQEHFEGSTRKFLAEIFDEPLLIEMLLCPLMWYGNARAHDMDYGQFCIMFRSIFMEGFARPYKGVRLILKHLIKRFRSLGGELKLRSAVQSIRVDGDRAVGVVLEDGQELQAKRILSSAGIIETQRLCDDLSHVETERAGQLTFIESISILDKQPREVGFEETIVFYNDSDQFHWNPPQEGLCDVRTGVICSPNNYRYSSSDGELEDGIIRLTTIADFDRWENLSEQEYQRQKMWWYDRSVASAVRFIPDFRGHVVATDVFTPKTIRRFTSHDNGAVYGAPDKKLDGTTHLKNLFLCGTDQGFVGIIGAIVSGISMANMHCLRNND